MTHELHFPPCALDPPHPLHPPPSQKPLRIQAFAPLSAIEKLIRPGLVWDLSHLPGPDRPFQECALPLATLVYRKIYGSEPQTPEDLVLCHETIGHTNPEKPEDEVIYRGKVKGLDTFAVTFDHLVPSGDRNPETLQIMIFETEYDDAAFATSFVRLQIDPKDYAPYQNRLFGTFRCCDKARAEGDRERINLHIKLWRTPLEEMDEAFLAEHE